jgi:serine/threonine-protein kinase RsbW
VTRRTPADLYAELAGTPHAARQARDLVRDVLGDGHPYGRDAELIASELVTNAVAHTRSGHPGGTVTFAIAARTQPDEVRILVRDDGGPGAPATPAADPDREYGRGLAIVSALATEWGSHAGPTGRATWCRLSADRTPHREPVRHATAAREPEREAG